MSQRIALVVAVGLVALGLYLLVQSFSNPLDVTGERDTTTSRGTKEVGHLEGGKDGHAQEGPGAESNRVAVPAEASAAAADPASEVGGLRVRVRWRDGKPAAGVAVVVHSWQPVYHIYPQRLANEQGIVEFTGLQPGEVQVSCDRDESVDAKVEGGKVVEVVLELKGVEVQGVVVDDTGAAVGDAGIWLTRANRYDSLGGRVVTRSDSSGEFRLRGVPPGQSLGALAKGLAPSELVDLDDLDTTKAPVRVRLVVAAPGGAVRGTVRSPGGDPVAGADISVGSPPRFLPYRQGHGYVEVWTPLVTSSDAQGRFEFLSLAPGKHSVAVRFEHLPIWKGEVVVEAGATSRLDVQLLEGVVVKGVVTDGAKVAIAGAVVRAYDRPLDETFIQSGQFDYDSVFGFPFTAADGNGSYRLSGIAPGAIHLYATRPERRSWGETKMRAKTVLQGKDGEELQWDPVIAAGNSIAGVVTYRDGVPMNNCFVNLENEKTKKRQAISVHKHGRFQFTNLEAAYYTLSVQYPFNIPRGVPPLEQGKVWPDTGEVRLIATFDSPQKQAPGTVVGRVQDAAGRKTHAAALGIQLKSDRGSWRTGKVTKEGGFEFKRVEPGKFRLVVLSGEEVIHVSEWFELMPAENHDVGTLVTQPGGSLRVKFARDKGTEKIEPRCWAWHISTNQYREIRPGLSEEHLEKNLSVGTYRISVWAKDLAQVSVSTEVEVGKEAVVMLRLRRGASRTFEMQLPEGHEPGKMDITIYDSGGKVCWWQTATISAASGNLLKRTVNLGTGSYTVKVKTTAGRAGEQAFEVKDLGAQAPTIHVTVK